MGACQKSQTNYIFVDGMRERKAASSGTPWGAFVRRQAKLTEVIYNTNTNKNIVWWV